MEDTVQEATEWATRVFGGDFEIFVVGPGQVAIAAAHNAQHQTAQVQQVTLGTNRHVKILKKPDNHVPSVYWLTTHVAATTAFVVLYSPDDVRRMLLVVDTSPELLARRAEDAVRLETYRVTQVAARLAITVTPKDVQDLRGVADDQMGASLALTHHLLRAPNTPADAREKLRTLFMDKAARAAELPPRLRYLSSHSTKFQKAHNGAMHLLAIARRT